MQEERDGIPATESEVQAVLGSPDHFTVVLKNGLVYEFNQPGSDSAWTQVQPVPSTEGHRLYWKEREGEYEKMMKLE